MKLKTTFRLILVLAVLTLTLPSRHTSATCTLPACDLGRIFFESNFTDEIGYINITCFGTYQSGSRSNYYDHTEYADCGNGQGYCAGIDYRCAQGIKIDAVPAQYIGTSCPKYVP